MIQWINVLIQGVMVGGLYALMAIGLSLAFGIMRLVNIAHGDLTVLSAFLAFSLAAWLGVGAGTTLAIMPLVVLIMGVLGYSLQRSILNRLLHGDLLPPLLATFGLSIVIQNGLLELFSANPRSLQVGPLKTASLELLRGLRVGLLPLIVIAVAVVVFGLLQLLFSKTTIGRAMRAVADDLETAKLMGINYRHVYALAMGLAMAVTAIGGFFFAVGTSVAPDDGGLRLIYAFEAVIIGGLGSLWGTCLGAIILGVAQAVALQLSPAWGILGGHLAFLLILMFRQQGLMPMRYGS